MKELHPFVSERSPANPFVSERSPAKASEVTRSATVSCQDIGHIVVIARKLSGDRGDGKTVQEKGIVA